MQANSRRLWLFAVARSVAFANRYLVLLNTTIIPEILKGLAVFAVDEGTRHSHWIVIIASPRLALALL